MQHEREASFLCLYQEEIAMYVYFTTFGCKVNSCETAGMAAVLGQAGHTICDSPERADVLVFNSCTITESSDHRLRSAVAKLQKKNPTAKIILTGCFVQAYPEAAKAIPNIDLILGTQNRRKLPDYLDTLQRENTTMCSEIPTYCGRETFETLPAAMDSSHTRAFLKIQDGCNQFCSYCIIPYARGRCRSMSPEDVRAQAESFGAQGYQELVLCGINLGFYGAQWNGNLAQAVQICCSVPEIQRVRLSSLEPDRLTLQVIEALSQCEKLCPQFHLALQSGCDRTLQQMHRRYTAAEYALLVETLRKKFPNCAITTDFMVSFPGETESDFETSLRFAKEMQFASMHVFRYSPRPGTKAATFSNPVSEAEKQRRMHLSQEVARENHQRFLKAQIGERVPVLFERERGGCHVGHTPNGTVIRIPQKNSKKSLRNQILYVIIESEYLELL
ncbi:MAG: tRNA (N(6)-L-threonylcarbamoyladenosine(37)-C(2))-methylthiotransferase MtaB [Ruminococcus sp.]|nr:tRNA (N(6)-L-threonylcarbamoyladenosine(37)-C(2))-methylthiotransferase MtaB [Ruminococcus sp.]